MREQVEKRIAQLKAEYRTGQEMLADLDARRADLEQTLLRISGALQVLQELLPPEPAPGEPGERIEHREPGERGDEPGPTPVPSQNGVLAAAGPLTPCR